MTKVNSPKTGSATAKTSIEFPAYVQHKKLRAWVEEMVDLCKPDQVYWCDGSQEEYDELCQLLVENGTFIKLNEKLRPNSYSGAFAAKRCCPRRRPHLYLQPEPETTPVRPTTGSIRAKCTKRSTPSLTAVCAVARCMSFPSAWDRWDRQSRMSASN